MTILSLQMKFAHYSYSHQDVSKEMISHYTSAADGPGNPSTGELGMSGSVFGGPGNLSISNVSFK